MPPKPSLIPFKNSHFLCISLLNLIIWFSFFSPKKLTVETHATDIKHKFGEVFLPLVSKHFFFKLLLFTVHLLKWKSLKPGCILHRQTEHSESQPTPKHLQSVLTHNILLHPYSHSMHSYIGLEIYLRGLKHNGNKENTGTIQFPRGSTSMKGCCL